MTVSQTTQDPEEPEKSSPEKSKPIRRKVTSSGDIAGHMRSVNGPSHSIQASPPTAKTQFISSIGVSGPSGHDLSHSSRVPTAGLPPANGQNADNQVRDIENLPTGALPALNGNGHENAWQAIAHLPTRALPADLRSTQGLEIEDGNVILHRRHNFFVRTVYRPGQKQNPLRRPTGRTTALPKVMPNQEKRIAASETRIMPSVVPINPVKEKAIPVPAWLEAIVVVIGLMASLVAHALNMFNFPRYELDEGTYMSSAWAILNGSITPYAYGYGHPPMAWIQIAAWVQLTGGFFTFGNALNSGRVLMLLYALGCSLLTYLIVRRLGGSRSAGLLAMIIFSLSPLSITYQRQVLLDNVATFWLLLSLCLLVVGNSRLFYIASAAISFGIAILSKEIFLLFAPVMIYAVWLHTTRFQRKFALVGFTYTIIALSSSFVLLAILKGELLPYDIYLPWSHQVWHLPWDTHNHLSMFDTFINQAQRGQKEGNFLDSWKNWTYGDIVLMTLSVVTVAFNLAIGWWNRKQLMLALFSISFWILLLRGGVVLSFYIIPMIPLVALNTAMAASTIAGWVGKLVHLDFVRALLVFGVLLAIVAYDLQYSTTVFTQHPTSAQTDAMVWIRANVPRKSFIVINSYLYMDLRTPGGAGVGDGATYPFAHVYFNVATDPELRDKLLQGNWDRIDYIVADSEMLNDIEHIGGQFKIIKDALDHSIPRAEFRADDHGTQLVIRIYQVIHKFPQPLVSAPPDAGNLASIRDATTFLRTSNVTLEEGVPADGSPRSVSGG